MKVLVSSILVLLAVSSVLAAKSGEEGGYCQGLLNVPVLLTKCAKECGIASRLPLVKCNDGLKCCFTEKKGPTTVVVVTTPEPKTEEAPAPAAT